MTKQFTPSVSTVCALIYLAISASAQAQELEKDHNQVSDVVREFISYVQRQQTYPDSVKHFIEAEWHRRTGGSDLIGLIPESLAVLHPRFKTGLDAYEAGEFQFCAKIMGELSMTSNRYLACYAGLFQIRSLIQEVQMEYAATLLGYYFREGFEVDSYCLQADELRFLHGYCLFHTFKSADAAESLQRFVDDYPAAPPQMRASAREMLEQLSPPPRKNLDLVAHLMTDAGLWLTEGEAGLDTQTRQRKALILLDEMIRQAKQQEQQSQQQNQGSGQRSTSSTQTPQRHATQSSLPEGESAVGQLHFVPRAKPGEAWGQMKPMERERILQVLQSNFPSRYRQLIEQYYSELAKEE